MALQADKPCRACGRPICWLETPKGARYPVDILEDEAGEVAALGGGRCRILRQGEELPAGATRHRSHWRTCTDPGRFSRRS